jgi:hypothetical protein
MWQQLLPCFIQIAEFLRFKLYDGGMMNLIHQQLQLQVTLELNNV